MKTLHLSIIGITLSAITLAIGVNAYGIDCTYCSMVTATNVSPSLAKINVNFNETTDSPIAITGTVYKLFSTIIVLKIQNPQGSLIAISQLQPTSDGSFSLTVSPSSPLWSMKGNYTATVSSGSQELGKTSFYFDGNVSTPTTHGINTLEVIASPLQQFKSGIATKDVKCNYDFELITKSEDGYPACVNPYVALRLAQIGWAVPNASVTQQLPEPSSALQLYLSVNPSFIYPREFVGIKLSVNNTLQNPIFVKAQNKWPYENVVTTSCGKIRLGIAILGGYYTAQNMTEGKDLQLFNKYDCNSQDLETGKVYEFQDQSNQVKEIMCYQYFGLPCPTLESLNMNYGFDGYWDKNNTKHPFNDGTYTVIGADEWGQVAIQHFTFTNSSSSSGPENKVGQDLLGLLPHQLVFFMKSNSTAKIFVEYTSNEPNTGTLPTYSSVYVGKDTFTPLATSDLTIKADPSSIPLTEGSDTTVVFSVTAKQGVKGVYWIFLVQFCRVMPLAVDINSLTISPSDISVQMGTMSCPAQVLDGKILGISGGTAEYKIGTVR
jgi:hypothetical protein